MKNKIFGTDGIRALETAEIFTKKNLRSLSKSIIKNKKKFKIVIGRDPRRSSSKIEKKLSDELKKSGGIVFLAGLTPTPTISYLTKKFHCKLGIVISASHNPYNFNGLKFFNAKGEKLSDKEEKQIEKDYFNFKRNDFKNKRDGIIKKINNPLKIYRSKFYKNYKIQTKGKIKIVIDCANGSTFKVAKQVLPKNIEFIFAGKTGSSQIRKFTEEQREKEVKQKDIVYKNRDHALYIAFAPYDDPQYAISVVVEHGGTGSSAAAPVAKKVIKKVLERHKLRETKNHLMGEQV